MAVSFQGLSNFIWSVADLLRGPYRPPQYERVMLPMTVLRRFEQIKDDKVKNITSVPYDGGPGCTAGHCQADQTR